MSTTDIISITIDGLVVPAQIGTNEWEKHTSQRLILDVVFHYPTPKGDSLDQAVDYTEVASTILSFCSEKHFQLLETLCTALEAHLLEKFPRCLYFGIKANKPGAIPEAKNVGCSHLVNA